jgi:hypothetical protein
MSARKDAWCTSGRSLDGRGKQRGDRSESVWLALLGGLEWRTQVTIRPDKSHVERLTSCRFPRVEKTECHEERAFVA